MCSIIHKASALVILFKHYYYFLLRFLFSGVYMQGNSLYTMLTCQETVYNILYQTARKWLIIYTQEWFTIYMQESSL